MPPLTITTMQFSWTQTANISPLKQKNYIKQPSKPLQISRSGLATSKTLAILALSSAKSAQNSSPYSLSYSPDKPLPIHYPDSNASIEKSLNIIQNAAIILNFPMPISSSKCFLKVTKSPKSPPKCVLAKAVPPCTLVSGNPLSTWSPSFISASF